MSIYLNISIQNDRFTISENGNKMGAVVTLRAIERVMRHQLKYAGTDVKHAQWSSLRERALAIAEGYHAKAARLWAVERFFGMVDLEEQEVEHLMKKINAYVPLPSPLQLPSEVIQNIFSRLGEKDLKSLVCTSKQSHGHVEEGRVRLAREYGYKGRDFAGAKAYLDTLFQTVDLLTKKGMTPVYSFQDPEKTLRYIKYMDPQKKQALNLGLYLCDAIRNRKMEEVRALLAMDVDVNWVQEWNGGTPLCVRTDDPKLTKLLLKKGASIDYQSVSSGYTALHYTAYNGELETLRVLLKRGANPNLRSQKGHTPLYLAALKGRKEEAALLLQHGADPNLASNRGLTPLTCNTGNAQVMELLLAQGACINSQLAPSEDNTALHYAAQNGELETLKVLLKRGANPNLRNQKGQTPLHLAVLKGRKQEVALLLEHGADPNNVDAWGMTTLCCNTRNAYVTAQLVEHGACIDRQLIPSGNTALHYAAQNGELETLRVLLKRGANPNLRDQNGETPLYLAALKSRKKEVALLLEYGADPNLANNSGWTPLNCNTDVPEITELLLRNGAEVNARAWNSFTALHYAAYKGQFSTARVLLKWGADPSLLTDEGETSCDLTMNPILEGLLIFYRLKPLFESLKVALRMS